MNVPQEGVVPNIYNNAILLFPLSCHGPDGEHTLANIYGCQFLQQDVSDVVEIFLCISDPHSQYFHTASVNSELLL